MSHKNNKNSVLRSETIRFTNNVTHHNNDLYISYS